MDRHTFELKYHNFLKEANVNAKQARVDAGGVLLLLGLRTETQDIDLTVPWSVFDRLVGERNLNLLSGVSGLETRAKWDEYIDIHVGETHTGQDIGGVWCDTTEGVLELKRALNRPKDQQDIKLLLNYLSQ